MDAKQTASLLRHLGVRPPSPTERLINRPEGWPALLALAALAATRPAPCRAVPSTAERDPLGDYLRSELLAPRTPDEVAGFLTRTS